MTRPTVEGSQTGVRGGSRAYFPQGIPVPEPTADDAGFWEGCRRHELLARRCDDCGLLRLPPPPLCPRCLSENLSWHRLPGTGVVFTFTFVHHVVEPGLREVDAPYNVSVIDLDESGGIRILGNVVDAAEDAFDIGIPVAVDWEDHETVTLPRFRVSR